MYKTNFAALMISDYFYYNLLCKQHFVHFQALLSDFGLDK